MIIWVLSEEGYAVSIVEIMQLRCLYISFLLLISRRIARRGKKQNISFTLK